MVSFWKTAFKRLRNPLEVRMTAKYYKNNLGTKGYDSSGISLDCQSVIKKSLGYCQITTCHPQFCFRMTAVFIGNLRYINILTWIRGFQVKIAGFFRLIILKRDLDTEKTPSNIEACPESLRAMLEYSSIEHGLLAAIRSHIVIIYLVPSHLP